MVAAIVGNLLSLGLTCVIIRGSILGKGLMSAVSVGSPLSLVRLFVTITEFTLEKGLLSAANAGSLLPEEIISLYT